MRKFIIFLSIFAFLCGMGFGQTKIRSNQLADSIHIQKTDFDDCVIDTLTITDSLIIISAEAIPLILGTATDGVRFQVDTSGTGTSDNDWIVADSLKAEELILRTVEVTPLIIGTATDNTRVSIDSTGTLALDNDLTVTDDASVGDSLKCEEINILTVEVTPFLLGTATDGTRASIDSTGTGLFDNDLSVGDSLKCEEVNILTVEASPFNLGTATDGTRATIDSTGSMLLDNDFKCDSIYATEVIIITDEANPFVIGTATDGTRFGVDSTGTLTLDNDLSVLDDASIADSLIVEEVNILSTDAIPLVIGTVTDGSRAYVDSSGDFRSDGWISADSLHARNTLIINSSKSSPFILGTATDANRSTIDSTGSMTLDNDLSVADSIKAEEVNILTVEATPFVIGTATDGTRATIDSAGTLTLDKNLYVSDSIKTEEINILTVEAIPFVIGTATDGSRATIDSSGILAVDGNITVAGDSVITWADTTIITTVSDMSKDLTVSGTGMSGGANDVLYGADADVTITLATSKDAVAGDGLGGGEDDVFPGADADVTFTVLLDATGGLETIDDSINIKLDGTSLTLSASGLKITDNYVDTTKAGWDKRVTDDNFVFGGDTTTWLATKTWVPANSQADGDTSTWDATKTNLLVLQSDVDTSSWDATKTDLAPYTQDSDTTTWLSTKTNDALKITSTALDTKSEFNNQCSDGDFVFGGDSPSLATLTITVSIIHSVTAGITAVNPGVQGDGTLTTEVNEVSTVANANDAVTLPAAVAGLEVFIINNGANTLEIWPGTSDNLGAGVNTATTLASGSNVTFVAYDATNWEIK